ncbi:ABC transporter permease [Facilibium subflavum]|uniref:ABC transporter permease n=1 Tax=Facilibium subflavum TaxID=2219058 RepID=UPI000E646730|nr:ABC transporter permease [Facilibium subflavum]
MNRYFSISRYISIVIKEFLHMMRDRLTIGMVIGIPLIQLILFGFAINTNPKHLPTVLINQDNSPEIRTLISAVQNTRYFDIQYKDISLSQANQLMKQSKVQFIIQIPADFTRRMIKNQHPSILLTTDGTDPSAAGGAIEALNYLSLHVFTRYFQGHGLFYLQTKPAAFNVIVHNKYNPEKVTQYNIVPGLAGVILTMTLVMVTGLAITREYEQGTMESLLATPLRPLEVILGKITPYILVGYTQLLLILLAAFWLFNVPIYGSIVLLMLMTLPFIIANLLVGITFSTIAKTQLQAMQMTFFFFLPSILLSGFMFPFYGMPNWAQVIGNFLPLTHYLRIIRGIVLKGNDFMILWSSIWPILLFGLIIGVVCIKRYRQTL